MENTNKIYQRNFLFILLIGIVGFCFGLLDWDGNLVDLVYLKYDNKLLISFISANIGTARLLASLFCIKINDSQNPNFIFKMCMILCSIVAIISAVLFDSGLITLFVIVYLLEVLLLEIFSGYHYAYAYHSLPEQMAMNAHSKRISIFKVAQAFGIAIAGFICAKFIHNAFFIISILATFVFILCIIFVGQVKNFPKVTKDKKNNILKKLNLGNYSPYFRKWFVVRFIGRFALGSLIVLLSLKAIDSNLELNTLKISKSLLWILSGTSFFLSNYFMKKKLIVQGDMLLKLLIVVLILLSFFIPELLFVIIILYGVSEGFNTMSHLEMLRKDSDHINLAQKDMVINLVGYISKMLSAYLLLNINSNLALVIICILLVLSTLFEYKLFRTNSDKASETLS